MRLTPWLIATGLISTTAAFAYATRDTRPVYPTAALPPVGSAVDFRMPFLNSDTLRSVALHGRPTLLAFWSSECGVSARALSGLEDLHTAYGGRANIVVLADDSDRRIVADAMRGAGITAPVALANGRLQAHFDRSRTAPERQPYRVKFAMPGFLVLDARGRVAHRVAGLSLEDYQSGRAKLTKIRGVLDSLVNAERRFPLNRRPASLTQTKSRGAKDFDWLAR